MTTPPGQHDGTASAALGPSWRHQQAAQITQRHRQFGMHRLVDVERLTGRADRMISGVRTTAYQDRVWKALVASIEHVAR